MIGNYATKALEEVEGCIKNHKKFPSTDVRVRLAKKIPEAEKILGIKTHEDKVEMFELIHKNALEMSFILNNNVNWSLSQDAFPLIWHTFPNNDGLEGLRLPYPKMLIEYYFDYGALDIPLPEISTGICAAKRRIISLHEVLKENHPEEIPADGFILKSIIEVLTPKASEWQLAPAAFFVSYESLNKIESWFMRDSGNVYLEPTLHNGFFPSSDLYDLPHFRNGFNTQCEELSDELRIALGFLQIINCKNAPIEVVPPSEKLNKKRAKQGRVLTPTYRTLKVSGHVTTGRTSTGSSGPKKTHWRRGHIRNQPTAKGIIKKWIKPMIIGAGKADKPEIVLT